MLQALKLNVKRSPSVNEMQNKLNRYYEEASIASVEEVKDGNDYYNYEKMFSSFRCPKKRS